MLRGMRAPHPSRLRTVASLLGLLALGLLAWGGPGVAGAAPGDFVRIEAALTEEQARLAKAWLDLALELAARDQKTDAQDALSRARAAQPELPGLAEAEARISAMAGAGVADEASAKRIARTREEAAKGYERMAKVLDKEQQDARYAEFLVIALQLSPTKARVATLAAMAQKAPLLVMAEGQPFAGWLSLPKSWKPGKPTPLLLVFEGEALQFAGALGRFTALRKDAPWMILAPLAFSCGDDLKFDRYFPAYPEKLVTAWNARRAQFDEAGLPGLVDFVRTHFGAAQKAALASFGKGADPALAYLMRHPGLVSAASLAQARVATEALPQPEAPEGGGPPIDLLGPVTAKGDLAALLGARGFARVTQRTPDAQGDAASAALQWAWITTPEGR